MMRRQARTRRAAALIAGALAAAPLAAVPQQQGDDGQAAAARATHDRILTIDSHVDFDVAHFTDDCNYTQRLTTQVNLPKMREGGLDVVFLIVHVPQGALTPDGYADAYRQATAQFDAVHRLTNAIAPRAIGLALSPADVIRIAAEGRRVAVIGIENGYPVGTDVERVREFYRRGGRYMSLAHQGHNQLSDSNSGEASGDAPNDGLSALGREVVAEMNRLGMMIDVSHPSRASILQAIALSQAPVIASHSAVRALGDHSRNLDDEQLTALARNGGVVQIVAYAGYLRVGARAGRRPIRNMVVPGAPCPLEPPGTRPLSVDGRPGVAELVDHIDYAVKRIGIDHVGIASDFEGAGGIEGWDDAAQTANVTFELLRRGYSEADIARLWGGNLLRVWREVEAVARRLQSAP